MSPCTAAACAIAVVDVSVWVVVVAVVELLDPPGSTSVAGAASRSLSAGVVAAVVEVAGAVAALVVPLVSFANQTSSIAWVAPVVVV